MNAAGPIIVCANGLGRRFRGGGVGLLGVVGFPKLGDGEKICVSEFFQFWHRPEALDILAGGRDEQFFEFPAVGERCQVLEFSTTLEIESQHWHPT